MKRLLYLLLAVIFAVPMASAPAFAQNAIVVASCGTLPIGVSYAPGQTRPVLMDVNGNNCTSNGSAGSNTPISTPATSGQLSGTAIDLQGASGAQIEIGGLSADSLAVTQGMGPNCSTATYVTATVLKQDLSTTAASALTGASANGIYSVMVFGGCLKLTRTGSADTGLTVTFRGTK